MIQEFNSMHCCLEAVVKALRRHGDGFLFSTMHIMKKTVTSSNGVSGGCNMAKEGVVDLVEGVRFVHSVVIFFEVVSSMS